jgi:membrane-associated phospholipid phosphatase
MTTYYRTTLAYLLVAAALFIAMHGYTPEAFQGFIDVGGGYVKVIVNTSSKVLPFVLVVVWFLGRKLTLPQLRQIFLAGVSAIMLQMGFLLFKSAIPQLVPFYADPFLAELDRALLFGHDAWQLADLISPDWLVGWFPAIYLVFWSYLAYSFQVLIVASDHDDARVLRYSWLFLLSWVVNGNLLALIGSSVGPIYYDLLLGTDRFAEMHAAFEASGFSQGKIARLQMFLWEQSHDFYSYISAFPSVHVAVAGVAALYLRERFRLLWPIGALFAASILLISVYSGYHYLLDGVVSLGVVWALNGFLRRVLGRQSP